MKRRIIYIFSVLTAANLPYFKESGIAAAAVIILLFVLENIRALVKEAHTERLRLLKEGAELLRLFSVTSVINGSLYILSLFTYSRGEGIFAALLRLAVIVAVESVVFWRGMIKVYLTSVQLGIKHRIAAVFAAWVPVLNIWYLCKIIRIASEEADFEEEKQEKDRIRAESEICKTRYPILLVHGVFFRDFKYVGYWGRIPAALLKNGATVYCGEQQSALSVKDSGRELSERIRKIVSETGCGKVNIIAHSKGGLDSREAIAHCGAAEFVASLTTINTPHRGCIFAEYLLEKIKPAAQKRIADTYNEAARHLGDTSPDFMAAVRDLTQSACLKRNELTEDASGVLYESVASYCKKAQNGRFPLNMTYHIVKHFDGKNDGLVSVKSAIWGSGFTLLEPCGRRGISHADVVDLNRENIKGFDVREFYVKLAANLKNRGY